MPVARRKAVEAEAIEDPPTWITTFADLISLMLTFFILLVSMSSLDRTGLSDISTYFKQAVSAFDQGEAFEVNIDPMLQSQRMVSQKELMLAMRQRSHHVLQDSALAHKVNVRIVKDHLIFSIDNAALFEDGDDSLSRESTAALQRLASLLAASEGAIHIEGYAAKRLTKDARFHDLWSLSLARASQVLDVLRESGVNPLRLSLAGYGDSRLPAGKMTVYDRKKYERVSIVLYQE